MTRSQFALTGNVKLYEFPSDYTYQKIQELSQKEKDNFLKDTGDNLVVDVGLAQIADLMIATNTNSFAYCVVGSGTNTPAAGDTNMQTIIGTGPAVTNRYRSGSVAYFDTFFSTSANAGTWNETGISTTNAGTVLLCRRKFSSSFVKSSSNTALVAWTITLAAVAD
ncbi:tail-collar fiber protein [Nitrososphaeria virus YSH_922147]|uniref:Tail-collar fiber protein n=1 Tax=Nitrososphaeria virus YSH_922147 TaxID=3071323 RepID=A0A976UBI1_9CAUD|nr:tail-collar fiber protein [Yangshan Harbor Nitrososphaeria virus]UVF62450.1 tail-collar fiber protein [Nitrososphaeria virus YSH_922147]